jgi:ABC-type uncharacterized transport system auxiliary subunit
VNSASVLTGATMLFAATGCFRGKLPPRELYRLASVDAPVSAAQSGVAPLSGTIVIRTYSTPGIYGSDLIVYRVGDARYGAYPSREWAVPLGEMLGAITERVVSEGHVTSGRVAYNRAVGRDEDYEWRGTVRQFEEVDAPGSVSASVSLTAELVRVADDSVLWSGATSIVEPVRESRSMDSVVAALSTAAVRAIARLADDANATLRRLAASGARDR